MTVFNLGMSAGAALVGLLRSHFNWQIIFLVFGLLNIISLIIVKYIKTNNHLSQVDQLEKNYLAATKSSATPIISPEAI
jgi:MFS transporter, PAT family, beta-lactamase induction signal transducer AmpG